jgi:hypothetical protein
MNNETKSLLKTVYVAHRVRSGFNGNCNARLEDLVEAGLMFASVDSAPKRIGPPRVYELTPQGEALAHKLLEEECAS